MKRVSMNFGWFRTLGELLPWEGWNSGKLVDLPDDFVYDLPRSPEAVGAARVGYFADGYATYTKEFELPAEWRGKALRLNIDGAYMNATVKLNENNLAKHPYGYSPFVVELTGLLREDRPNRLSIACYGDQPSSRWYSGAGLYRGVELWVGETCYLDRRNLVVTTPVATVERGLVRVAVTPETLSAVARAAMVKLELRARGRLVAAAETELTIDPLQPRETVLELMVEHPLLWDDVEPNLYDLTVRVCAEGQADDVTELKVGIREIRLEEGRGLTLNGRTVTLYGGCIHHDHNCIGARAMPKAEEHKLTAMKAAGFNAIRTAHNPPSEALLDVCDRLGILVIDEFFDCWRTGKNRNDYNLYFEDWWQRDIAAIMRRDRNHPSVYCWSFGNEISESDGRSDGVYWTKVMAAYIRSLDNTRLVTNGGMFMPRHLVDDGSNAGMGGPPMMRNPYMDQEQQTKDFREMIDCLDIVSLNYSHANYARFAQLFPGKWLQGTEHSGAEAWANAQAVAANDHVIGDFMWTAYDNLGEAGAGRSYWEPEKKFGLMADWPWLSCFQGDLAMDGERLPRSYYRKVIWGKDDGAYLFTTHPAHTGQPLYGTGFHWHDVKKTWSFGPEWIGKPVDVEVYADCDEVEYYVNGVCIAKAQPEQMIAHALVNYQPGELKIVAFRDGKPVAEDRVETTGPVAGIVLVSDRNALAADGMDLAYVECRLVDAEGRLVDWDDRELSASVCGAGVLLGFGSNNPCTVENYGTGRRVSWNGRAMLVLRAAQTPGPLTVTVMADGLPTVSATVCVE